MRNNHIFEAITFTLGACAVVVACTSTSVGTGASGCANDYSGRWKLSGSCTSTTCDVTQSSGCSLSVQCDDGATGSGTVTGNKSSVTGLLGSGDTGACEITFAGSSFSMSCSSSRSTQSCTGTGACESGSCGKAGGPDAKTVPCKAKPGSDTDPDCSTQADRPRKLDCDADQTEIAVAAGCKPTKPGDSDVCCPLTVSGTTEGSSSGTSSGSTGTSGTSGTVDAATPVTCAGSPPLLFPPVAGTGPYCSGAPTAVSNHCPLNQKCCQDPVNPGNPTTRECAAVCPTNRPQAIGCYSAAECPGGQVCCGKGTPDTLSCSYLTVRGLSGTVCSAACRAGEYVACYTNTQCNGGACRPAYVLNQAGTGTANMMVGVCR